MLLQLSPAALAAGPSHVLLLRLVVAAEATRDHRWLLLHGCVNVPCLLLKHLMVALETLDELHRLLILLFQLTCPDILQIEVSRDVHRWIP